jgi:mono/diheme cytochrome c family protein
MEQQALRMPAYRGYLSEKELADLVAYTKAASGLMWPQDDLTVKGMNLAYKNGCFACHNVMGSGGFKNPGSFKGYIPGWWESDFNDLVRSEEELREWIKEGEIKRLTSHPLARYFVKWQRVKMPKFKKFLKEEEIEALIRYVQWVHRREWHEDQQ